MTSDVEIYALQYFERIRIMDLGLPRLTSAASQKEVPLNDGCLYASDGTKLSPEVMVSYSKIGMGRLKEESHDWVGEKPPEAGPELTSKFPKVAVTMVGNPSSTEQPSPLH